eukprot:TRINITY_DN7834_c0_g3_i1.p1 TRINITY_DN7834_c0_g3~~TRINITY_DN7834_c0_g3_i1.p1  ORF type:complete len:736 (-),score=166.66 TRINITY_DN7834_c0_g3_i1:74-2281(-)
MGRGLTFRENWKAHLPVLYDWLMNTHLMWPTQSCRWGPVVADLSHHTEQRVYLSEQTDGSCPNTLMIATVIIPKVYVATPEHIKNFADDEESEFFFGEKRAKTLLHPGEVNRIRELPQAKHILATHSDIKEVFVWNTDTQPNRIGAKLGTPESKPDLVLVGHKKNAEFALATTGRGPYVLSGGKDNRVVLWSIEDSMSGALASSASQGASTGGRLSRVDARGIYEGHSDTVDDVQFRPSSANEFCSVGDDTCVLMWDARTGYKPVLQEKCHKSDVNTVDWSSHDENLIVTGSADKTVKLIDRRKMRASPSTSSSPPCVLHTFNAHKEAVMCVQWAPQKAGVFASGADDGVINVWDISKMDFSANGNASPPKDGSSAPPAGLLFEHLGHRERVTDLHWNPSDPWGVVSASVDSGKLGGGTLQVWRVNPLVHLPTEEALAQIKAWQQQAAAAPPAALQQQQMAPGGLQRPVEQRKAQELNPKPPPKEQQPGQKGVQAQAQKQAEAKAPVVRQAAKEPAQALQQKQQQPQKRRPQQPQAVKPPAVAEKSQNFSTDTKPAALEAERDPSSELKPPGFQAPNPEQKRQPLEETPSQMEQDLPAPAPSSSLVPASAPTPAPGPGPTPAASLDTQADATPEPTAAPSLDQVTDPAPAPAPAAADVPPPSEEIWEDIVAELAEPQMMAEDEALSVPPQELEMKEAEELHKDAEKGKATSETVTSEAPEALSHLEEKAAGALSS